MRKEKEIKFTEFLILFYFNIIRFTKKFAFSLLIILTLTVTSFFLINKSDLIPYKTFTISSGSMEPTLEVEEFIIVKKQTKYITNEIVTFVHPTSPKKIVTHRIIRINRDNTISTKGDNNISADTFNTPIDNIIGTVVYQNKYLGSFYTFITSVLGIITMFVIPTVILITLNLVDIYKWFNQKVEEIKNKYSI